MGYFNRGIQRPRATPRADKNEPIPGTVYRSKVDGHRVRFNGRPSTEETRRNGYAGWSVDDPDMSGHLVGEAWGWPHAYDRDDDQSWGGPR